jgi:biopolymer transport protein ExbB
MIAPIRFPLPIAVVMHCNRRRSSWLAAWPLSFWLVCLSAPCAVQAADAPLAGDRPAGAAPSPATGPNGAAAAPAALATVPMSTTTPSAPAPAGASATAAVQGLRPGAPDNIAAQGASGTAIPKPPQALLQPKTQFASEPPLQTDAAGNPYGLSQLWSQGDFVARGAIVILLIMSMGTWYIAIVKLFEQTRLLVQARVANKSFWTADSLPESIERLKKGSAFRLIAESGLAALEHHEGSLVERIDLNTWVTLSIQRAGDALNARLQRGLAFLATVGSTAPFVGLFGTVWGIYHALVAIGLAGQASIDKVAGPVGEALIMTAIGLAVAVPAVLGYNWLVRRNKAVGERVKAFSSDLHSVLLSDVGIGAPGRLAPATRPAAAVVRTA